MKANKDSVEHTLFKVLAIVTSLCLGLFMITSNKVFIIIAIICTGAAFLALCFKYLVEYWRR